MTATKATRVAAGAGLAIAAIILAPRPAAADPITTLTVSGGPSLQQILNRPCVIGDPSCHNPKSFAYTRIPPHDGADTISSPTYTVEQIRDLVGDTFMVGVDLNQGRGHDGGAYDLLSFSLSVNGSVLFKTASPTVLMPINPGNGYSDASITGFNLAGLPSDARLVFTTTFSGGTAGREQFFLRAVKGPQGTASPTPEPASLMLVGSGLIGTAFAWRRRTRNDRGR